MQLLVTQPYVILSCVWQTQMESNSRARCAQEMQRVGSSLLIRLTGRTEHIHIFYSYANQNKLKIGQKYTEVNEISNQIILCGNMLARTNK